MDAPEVEIRACDESSLMATSPGAATLRDGSRR
jgi:hypothetical protein